MSLCLVSCSHQARARVYVSLPERGGLVRAQDKEVLGYGESRGYLCVSPADLEVIMTEARECKR